jgi:hypothetical protein
MGHANELIKQIIRKQNLHLIYPGQEESAFGDLVQTAWMQIERTLYKFRAKPHCRTCYNPDRPMDSALYVPRDDEYGIITFAELVSKEINPRRQGDLRVKKSPKPACPHCNAPLAERPLVRPAQGLFGGSETVLYRGNSKVFNMWSQVARTVILAFVKKEGRDKKNAGSYKDHLSGRTKVDEDRLSRFFGETFELCKYNNDHLQCLEALRKIVSTDDKPHDGLIGKLVRESGLSRAQVTGFIRMMRLRSHEFTDSPISREEDRVPKYERNNDSFQDSFEDEC